MPGAVEIKGYPEFQKALKKIDRDFPKAMQEAGIEVANEWVRAAKGNTTTSQQSLAATGLRVGPPEPTGGLIVADSPVFQGAEFGGRGRPETMQFPPHRGQRGYFFYPAARANADRLNAIWDAGIDKAMAPWNHRE